MLICIKTLLNANKYKSIPRINPIKGYNLSSPLLNLKIEKSISIPLRIPNKASSTYVIKSGVLKLILSILKQSNNSPIINPFKIKMIKINICSCNKSPYLNNLLKNEESFCVVFFSE